MYLLCFVVFLQIALCNVQSHSKEINYDKDWMHVEIGKDSTAGVE